MASNGSPGAGEAPSVEGAHHEIARDIGQQVELMILESKRAAETKVSKEITKIKAKLEQMNEKLRLITEKLARLDPLTGAGGLARSDLQKSITKLEEVWEAEVSTLKHELWQTIQAHNHNADLLKHHKDAIDGITGRITEIAPSPELESVHAQLLQVDKIMQRESAKEHQMDQLVARLQALQGQLGILQATGGVPFAAGQAAVPFPAGSQAATAGATGAAPGQKKAKPKTANGGVTRSRKDQKAANAMAASSAFGGLTLRAEAPEFVPTSGM